MSSVLTACSSNARAGESQLSLEPALQQIARSTDEAHLALPELPAATPEPQKTALVDIEVDEIISTKSVKMLTTPFAEKKITEESPIPSCLLRGGQMIISTFATDLIPLPLDYRVYLPPCYRQNYDQRYPLLILIHGQSFTDDQWDRLGVDETIDRLVLKGELPPFIVLMPRDRYGGESNENYFAKAVMDELLPSIDETYRTYTDREYRAVGGLSRGAGWAVHMGMVYGEEFSKIGAHSPAIFYTDAQQMRTWLDTLPRDRLPSLFVDIGERDRPEILDSAYWLAGLLNEKDIPHEWYLFAGFHNEEYWASHVEKYLRWYAQNW